MCFPIIRYTCGMHTTFNIVHMIPLWQVFMKSFKHIANGNICQVSLHDPYPQQFFSSILTLVTQQGPFGVMDIFTHYLGVYFVSFFYTCSHWGNLPSNTTHFFMKVVLPPKQITPHSFALI